MPRLEAVRVWGRAVCLRLGMGASAVTLEAVLDVGGHGGHCRAGEIPGRVAAWAVWHGAASTNMELGTVGVKVQPQGGEGLMH